MLIGLNLLTRTLYFALPNGQGFFRFYAGDAVENLANDYGNVAMAAIFNKSEYDNRVRPAGFNPKSARGLRVTNVHKAKPHAQRLSQTGRLQNKTVRSGFIKRHC
jgi:hypothetical protein